MKRTPSAAATSTLDRLLDRKTLQRLAGARAFARGEEYMQRGLVGEIDPSADAIRAQVRGTRRYEVELKRAGKGLDYDCTCPVGQDGGFCKHAVALGLTWLERRAPSSGRVARAPQLTLEDVRAHLLQQDPHALVELLMEQAAGDDQLRRRLLLLTARRDPRRPAIAAYRQAIDEAVRASGHVSYRDAAAYAHDIERVIDDIERLLTQGHATDVIALSEHALAAMEQSIGDIDDSDGELGGLMERVQELHLAACKKARPDPDALARRLFAWELRTEWDVFHGAARTYADVLGRSGLAVYRALADAEWSKVPARGRGRPGRDVDRFRITHIMETLAEMSGDVEALVAVKQRDLSSAHAYLQIAEIYRAAGRHDQALDWAERGLRAFPDRTDARLREFAAEAYHRRKRHDEAMALIWSEFEDHESLSSYQCLLAHAERIGQRAAWRERALAHVRRAPEPAKRRSTREHWSGERHDHSLLVQILLWEKDVDAAWSEARAGGCSRPLWMELAAKRETSHPQDALAIYLPQIEPIIDRTGNHAYREALTLLRKVRKLMHRIGPPSEFETYRQQLRARHARKRNFVTLLDRAKW